MRTIQFEGDTFIQGLHGIPDYYKEYKDTKVEDWYWKKGTKKEDHKFLNKKWLDEPVPNPLTPHTTL